MLMVIITFLNVCLVFQNIIFWQQAPGPVFIPDYDKK